MELTTKLLEQIAFKTTPKIEERIFKVTDKPTQEELLYEPLQTINKQLMTAVTFLIVYNGILNVTNAKNMFYFLKSIADEDGFVQNTIPPSAYKIEVLDKELQRNIIGEDHFRDANYPLKIKPTFSTLGSIVEIPPQGSIFGFMFDDRIGHFVGFNARTIYEEYNLSTNPVDIISFNNTIIETHIAKEFF